VGKLPSTTQSDRDLALAIEKAVCLGRADVVMLEHAELRSRRRELPSVVAFSLGRAAEDEQAFGEARDLFDRAASGEDAETAARAEAHLAYLDYYARRCENGLARAVTLARSHHGIAASEAYLYASVNAQALNRALDALALGQSARNLSGRVRDGELRRDLHFRIARQLTHVLVAHGDYSAAASEAETASAIARATGGARLLGLAAYLRGYVHAARGDPLALTLFREADRHWGGGSRSFGHWLQYVWAVSLRDLGDIAGARNLRLASGIRVPWEEPLFELAEGSSPTLPDPTNCAPGDLPYMQAGRGVVFLALGKLPDAREMLVPAVREFERCDFHHDRRGAVLALAATELAAGDVAEAERLIRKETPALVRQEVRTWPWWRRPTVVRLARFAIQRGLAPNYWRRLLHSANQGETTLLDVLRARDLTERQIEIVRTWLADPQRSRGALAAALGIGEASVRAHLNVIRKKLGCDSRRGAGVIRDRIAAFGGTYRAQ